MLSIIVILSILRYKNNVLKGVIISNILNVLFLQRREKTDEILKMKFYDIKGNLVKI